MRNATISFVLGLMGAASLMAASPGVDPSLTLDAVAGARHYTGGGTGRCGREAEASPYERPATLYLVEYTGRGTGDLDRVSLTLWRFKDGSPDQLSLAFDSGRNSYSISTLQGSKIAGKGSAMVIPAGAAGRIVLKGQDARGVPIQITVGCSEFSGIEAEGG